MVEARPSVPAALRYAALAVHTRVDRVALAVGGAPRPVKVGAAVAAAAAVGVFSHFTGVVPGAGGIAAQVIGPRTAPPR